MYSVLKEILLGRYANWDEMSILDECKYVMSTGELDEFVSILTDEFNTMVDCSCVRRKSCKTYYEYQPVRSLKTRRQTTDIKKYNWYESEESQLNKIQSILNKAKLILEQRLSSDFDKRYAKKQGKDFGKVTGKEVEGSIHVDCLSLSQLDSYIQKKTCIQRNSVIRNQINEYEKKLSVDSSILSKLEARYNELLDSVGKESSTKIKSLLLLINELGCKRESILIKITVFGYLLQGPTTVLFNEINYEDIFDILVSTNKEIDWERKKDIHIRNIMKVVKDCIQTTEEEENGENDEDTQEDQLDRQSMPISFDINLLQNSLKPLQTELQSIVRHLGEYSTYLDGWKRRQREEKQQFKNSEGMKSKIQEIRLIRDHILEIDEALSTLYANYYSDCDSFYRQSTSGDEN